MSQKRAFEALIKAHLDVSDSFGVSYVSELLKRARKYRRLGYEELENWLFKLVNEAEKHSPSYFAYDSTGKKVVKIDFEFCKNAFTKKTR